MNWKRRKTNKQKPTSEKIYKKLNNKQIKKLKIKQKVETD